MNTDATAVEPAAQEPEVAETALAYINEIHDLLDRFTRTQMSGVSQAAHAIADSLALGGVLHVFGSGHSQMAAQEIYLRAGGLAVVNAILDPNLSFYGTANSDRLERLEGYAEILLHDQDLRSGEVVIVISNSGLNAVPIDVARIASERGCLVVAITSATNYSPIDSRHSSGQRLTDIAHIVIDTGVPLGDAVVPIESVRQSVGAISTTVTAAAMQAIIVETVATSARRDESLAILWSANVPGGDEQNLAIVERYRHRLPNMRL